MCIIWAKSLAAPEATAEPEEDPVASEAKEEQVANGNENEENGAEYELAP